MNTFSPETYFDPLFYALGGNPARLQAFVDSVTGDINNMLQIDGFDWNDDLLDDFTYSQVEKYVGIAPMAPVVDPDSPAIPFRKKGEVIGTGSIPRMKTIDYLNEAKVRALKKLIRRNDVTVERVREAAGAAIGEIFVEQVKSYRNSITFQRDQMVSTGGIAYNKTNNPYGIELKLSARVPAENTVKLIGEKRWWTDAALTVEGTDCDPIADLKAQVRWMKEHGVDACHFEVNSTYLDKVLSHSKIVAAIKERISMRYTYSINTLDAFNTDEQILALSQVVGKPIMAKGHISAVEYEQGGKVADRQFDSFAANVFVLVPDGKIGDILTVEPLLYEGGRYAFALDGKVAFTIETDYLKKCQAYGGELTTLTVPDRPRLMRYLKPNEA